MASLKRATVGLGLGLVILVLVGAYSLRTTRLVAEHYRWVAHSLEIKATLKGLLVAVVDAETARRGYALTGNEALLEPVPKAELSARDRLRALRELTTDNPRQQRRLESLAPLVEQRLALIREAISLQRGNARQDGEPAALGVRGTEVMDAVRGVIAEMQAEEDDLLRQRQETAAASSKRATAVISVGSLVALALVGAATLVARRERQEREAAAAALRESEGRLRAILDNSTALVYLKDTEGRFLLVNRRFLTLFGAATGKVVGSTDHELFGEDVAAALRRNDADVLRRAEPLEFEETLAQADGPHVYLSVKFPLLDQGGVPYAVGGISTDVTDRRRLEEERNLLFNLSDDLIYIGATDRSFQRLNPAWERVLGHTREALHSRPAVELLHPEDRDTAEAVTAAMRTSGAPAAIENRLRCSDGSYRWMQWSVQADPDRGLTFAIGRDVTAQRELLDEMRRAREATEAANKELEAFSYSVSHDLRAPLRHIDGFVDLLRRKAASGLDETGRRYLRVISDAARKMGALIDDLLSFSRMGRTDMSRTRVDLGALLDEVLDEAKADAPGREIEWTVGPLPVVQGDPAMLRLMLANLVSNAVKYTRQRRPAHIEIGASAQDGERVLFVRDDGAGFDMRYADKLFGVFQRLHRVEEFEGTGIGLATVQRIVHRHAGRAWAEAAPDRGATFYVSLPGEGGSAE